jgi:DNA adenine methylase
MPATLTPLRYPGGKTKYAGLFTEIVSMNNLDNCTFVEVFAGGAGAAISLLLKGHVKSLFLNDLDVAIYAFWKSVKECPVEFVKLIRSTRISMAEWRRQKTIHDSKDISNMLALGFSTFYLNRCNHSGILEARPIGGMKQNSDYNISSRYNKATSIAKIEAIAKHANSLEIFNLDGVSFLKLLKRKYRNRKCLIYFDPPYYQKGPVLYLNHFGDQDHKSLRDGILKCPFPWVLSYDNHESIVDMYRNHDCNLYRNIIRHTITGNTKAEELIISKLNIPDYLEQL